MAATAAMTSATQAVADIRQRLINDRAAIRAQFLSSGDTHRLLRTHAQLVDQVLCDLWSFLQMPRGVTLIAVGGYGRGELFPASDVDVLVLHAPQPAEAITLAIERFIGLLWDVGLDVGHSVRDIATCMSEAERDITVQTTLMETRYLCGLRSLYERLRKIVQSNRDPAAFCAAKRLEQDQRHAKHQETPYALEANLKEAPGGLRDLHTMRWVAQAAGIEPSWRAWIKHALISRTEATALRQHETLLIELRARLHYLAGRREDRLLFDLQTALATQMGQKSSATRRASELLMQRYFQAAKAISMMNSVVLQDLSARLSPATSLPARQINERFQSNGGLLDVRSAQVFEREPAAILESFLLLQQHSDLQGMTAATTRLLWRARRRIRSDYRRNPMHRTLFMHILQQPKGILHALRRMNQYGILGDYLPAFGRIVGQMQHDLFHVYTVDQHSLMVLRNLRRFTMPELAHEFPLASQLMSGFAQPWLLYVAALFHDIAKGRGGDHSELGSIDAARFCKEHGLQSSDAAFVVFLVRQHLLLSTVAQKEDISDPEVIQRFATTVATERHLIALYLLTVADIRGTSPKVWNAWKANLLETLFRATRRVLTGGAPGLESAVAETQTEATRLLRLHALEDRVKNALWAQLDTTYFLRHDANEIAWHARKLYYRVTAPDPVVTARLSPLGEGLQVMIYTLDRKELFARICGYFDRLGFNIVEAKIHTTTHGYALDTFLILGVSDMTEHRDMIQLIETELATELQSTAPLRAPSRGRISRRVRHFPVSPSIELRADERGHYHLLSIVASDRTGLLYQLACVLARYGTNLRNAKINTLGDRAEDVFLISGEVLSNPRAVLLLEQDLLEAMQI